MGLLKSIAEIWRTNGPLCASIPFDRVFTGRLGGTELYRFPYCSIAIGSGWRVYRSDKTDVSHVVASFSIWLDDARLHLGELIQDAIYAAYANTCWTVREGYKVMDVLDMGEGQPKQTTLPAVKAWNVINLKTLVIERQRTDTDVCCDSASEFEPSSGSFASAESLA